METDVQDVAPYNTDTQFDFIAARIQDTFNILIKQLIKRMEDLGSYVAQLREDYLNREPARVQAVEELQKTQVQLEQMKRSNINLPVHEQAGVLYKEAEQQQSVPYQTPYLSFSCPSFSLLQSQIEQLGEVVQLKAPEYSQKQPILTPVVGRENCGLNGLSLDELNEKVYITDTPNHRVQVISFQGEILSQFGENVLSCPWGISASHGDIFVTDYGNHTLSRFCKNSHQLLYRAGLKGSDEGQLFGPRGLSVDWNGDLFVADRLNHRISVFSNHLQYKLTIGKGSLSFPKDVELTMDRVVVLDNSPKCIHFFSRGNGDLIASCVNKGLVYQPWFFCLDCVQNILISDHLHHVIKIFSSSEKLLHTIGKKENQEGKKKGEFKEPVGIALSNSGKLFVLSRNPEYSLQVF